jgi:hypothetical protein
MYSFRRLALLLVMTLPALHVLQAQSSSSSSSSASTTQDQAQPSAAQNQSQMSVQARIKARRDQRRAQAIHDTYSPKYEAFLGTGFLRYKPGPNLQKLAFYSWDAAVTRYSSERLGLTVDGRGYYGTAYVGLNPSSVTRPAISEYAVMAGPTYRFYMQPKYSLSGRVMGGMAFSNFSSDTNGFGSVALGMYPDGTTYALSPSIIGEANVSPNLSLRLAGDYYATGFGSEMQNALGFNWGFVYRFGKR